MIKSARRITYLCYLTVLTSISAYYEVHARCKGELQVRVTHEILEGDPLDDTEEMVAGKVRLVGLI